MSEQIIEEAAFQMYWHFIRIPDEERARFRWARMTDHGRAEWLEYARRARRVFEADERAAA
jgi:hypothetical protein